MQFLPLFVGYFKLVVQESKHHSLQSARCLADGLFEDRLEWLMVCMHCKGPFIFYEVGGAGGFFFGGGVTEKKAALKGGPCKKNKGKRGGVTIF